MKRSFASGERCGEHGVLGRAHGHEGEVDFRALQAAIRFGDDVTFVEIDLGAHRRQRLQVQIDGPRADRTSAGERNARLALSGEQRPEDIEGGAHLSHEIVGRLGRDNRCGGQLERRPFECRLDAMLREQLRQHIDISKARHVANGQCLVGEQRRRHDLKRGILRAAYRYLAEERAPANNRQLVHQLEPEIPKLRAGS